MCFSLIFEHFCILLRRSYLWVKDGKATSDFSTGLSADYGLWNVTQIWGSSTWATAHLLKVCSTLTHVSREHSYSSHPDEDNAQQCSWALQLLATARSTVRAIREGQFVLLHHRKFSNTSIHLEYSLVCRCESLLQGTQGNTHFLDKQQKDGVKIVNICSDFCNFDCFFEKLEKFCHAILQIQIFQAKDLKYVFETLERINLRKVPSKVFAWKEIIAQFLILHSAANW